MLSGALRLACVVGVLLIARGAAADELLVSEHRDDPLAPLVGSLRAVVAAAGPGDAVRFDVRRPVELAADIEIGDDLAGLQLLGPARIVSAGTSLSSIVVRGDGVSLHRLRARDVTVRVASSASGVQIGGCRFEGPHGGVEVRGARGTLVGLPGEPNRFCDLEPIGDAAMSGLVLDGDVGTRVEGNAFSGYQSGVLTLFSEDLVLRGNRFRDTGIEGRPGSATVDDNRLVMRRGGNAIFLVDDPQTRLTGPVVVMGNVVRSGPLGVDAIVVTREDASVVANTIHASGQARRQRGIVVGTGHPYHLAPARAEIRDNVVHGAGVGVAYLTERDGMATAVVAGNRVRGADGHGITVNVPVTGSVTVEANHVARGGGFADDAGIVAVSYGGSLVLASNRVRRNRVAGMQIHALHPASTADVRLNVVSGNAGHGIDVRMGLGSVSAAANEITGSRGDGYHFDAGTFGTVSLTGGALARNRGDAIFVAPGSVVDVIP